VIINGINIGKLFRDQFADAMQRNGNDLDKTIDGWAGEVAKAKEAADNCRRSQSMSEPREHGEPASCCWRRAGLPQRPGLRKQGKALIAASKASSAGARLLGGGEVQQCRLSLLLASCAMPRRPARPAHPRHA
jgi:hypothetical protein